MQNERLKNKRYLAYVRCSTKDAVGESALEKQIASVDAFAKAHEMVLVDKVTLEGVNGLAPPKDNGLATLLKRARQRADYEVLLVQDYSRLTRGGARAFVQLLHAFWGEGVEIVAVESFGPCASKVSPIIGPQRS
jgi:DNA invertase Pin-like site-specific DNA recombinase